MNVLHVYRTFFPDTQGGLEEVVRQICLNADPQGIHSRVFALSPQPQPQLLLVDGLEVVRVKQTFEIASCGFCFTGLGEFRRQVAWADVLHYHFPWPWGDVLHMLGGRGKPTVVTYHSDIVRQRLLQYFYYPLMNRFLGSAARIVATSPNYFATSAVLKRFADRVEVVPIGIDEDSYPPAAAPAGVLEGTRARYGEGFFLFVGVLRYYKGLHILLEAMKDARYRAVIVGSGPVEQELQAQAQRLGLDNVVFGGYVDDEEKMALYKLSCAVVFPSYLRAEAFGVTLLEGAMCGKPLISAEVGTGTSHINIHRQTGLVIPPGCPLALREAMDFLYYNPGRARAMGERGRARYELLFTGKTMGARYANIYRQVLDELAQATKCYE